MKKHPGSATNASSSKIRFKDSEESDESSSGEEEVDIENELADIPFEELQRARSDGTLAVHQKSNSEKKSKRANKNRPVEMSSKKPVSRFREVVQVPKKEKQLKSDSAKHRDAQILADHKKKEREAAKQGKRPFYLKKSEIRKQRLVEKYNDLKLSQARAKPDGSAFQASGKLDSYLEKRRRRNAAKDHRFMPYRRPTNEE
ncbi:hypothetical protein Cgig2_002441 [Carnegiea gigantea]|uniref:rRNA biogenesis protein RRP36 n=1 Tax=Carnegiea gigantea TaxID=171969 RepID=A0A9Q1QPF8_9CARY|nr:hypothetical protein Cgig2_002441 [Carnegiea gigantea]